MFMCFFSPIRNGPKKTHKQNFGTHPVPGQSRKFVYVYVFFLSLKNGRVHLLGIERLPVILLTRTVLGSDVPSASAAAAAPAVATIAPTMALP